MTTQLALLVLVGAFMHASWNYLVKAGSDGFLDTTNVTLCSALLAACALPFLPLPAAESLPWLALTIVLHLGYFASLISAYRYADLSLAYPLMRGSAPVIVTCAAPLFGDSLAPSMIAGVILIALGIMLPTFWGFRRQAIDKKGIYFAFANALAIAGYTLSDGLGVRVSGNPASYTLWLFFLNAWCLVAIAFWKRGSATFTHFQRNWLRGLCGGALSIGAYGIALWAMTRAPIPVVAALRETSVIFAAVLGMLFLNETMGRQRLVGASIIVLGSAIIHWS